MTQVSAQKMYSSLCRARCPVVLFLLLPRHPVRRSSAIHSTIALKHPDIFFSSPQMASAGETRAVPRRTRGTREVSKCARNLHGMCIQVAAEQELGCLIEAVSSG